jgi:membrane protein involved in colicin uptake
MSPSFSSKDECLLTGDVVKLTGEKHNKTKGLNVSGRSWKVRQQKRASSLVATKVNNRSKSWEKKRAEKLAKKQAQELQHEMKEAARQEAIEKKERRLENERRRAENEFKATSAQILNSSKAHLTLKSMNKKQLRQVKKTRLNVKTGVVEYVPAFSK